MIRIVRAMTRVKRVIIVVISVLSRVVRVFIMVRVILNSKLQNRMI
jgi:hypothetical protein